MKERENNLKQHKAVYQLHLRTLGGSKEMRIYNRNGLNAKKDLTNSFKERSIKDRQTKKYIFYEIELETKEAFIRTTAVVVSQQQNNHIQSPHR